MPNSFVTDLIPLPSGPVPSETSVTPQEAPLLPLETWRQLIGWNPFHFYQFSNSKVPITSDCDSLVKEYAWDNADQAGRDDIRTAILSAEKLLKSQLKFSVAPQFSEETLNFTQQAQRAMVQSPYSFPFGTSDPLGRWQSVELSEGYIQEIGVELLTLIDTATITLTDTDGDGLYDTFTASVTTDTTDTTQIACYFSQADRLDNDAVGDRWRILPVTVSISAGVCTVRGRSWMLAKPILYQGVGQRELDPDTLSNYVTTVEIYTRGCTPNGITVDDCQAKLIWETLPFPNCGCLFYPQSDTDPAAEAWAIGRAGIRNAKMGIVYPAQAMYNSDTQVWTGAPYGFYYRRPDRVEVRFYAGYPLDGGGQMQSALRQADAHLACAELQERISGCTVANRALEYWQQDISRTGTTTETYYQTKELLNSPFGTRRGQVDAFRRIKRFLNVSGVAP